MEVYENEMTKYDPHTREGGLFADYINTIVKLKAEASGYPSWFGNTYHEERYVETFYAREGVLLDNDDIRPNAAKRGLAKLFEFALGKIGRMAEPNQDQADLRPGRTYRFPATPEVEVVNLFASDSVVWVPWKYTAEEETRSLRHTNGVLAEYGEGGSGMHLYAHLHKLGKQALYCERVLYLSRKPTKHL